MVLPTDVTPGYPGHADLHNSVNEAVNALDVSASAPIAFSSGAGVYGTVFRAGTVVYLSVQVDTTGGLGGLAAIPAGYRPHSGTFTFIPGVETNSDASGALKVDETGDVFVYGPSSDAWTFGGTWITDDAAPA